METVNTTSLEESKVPGATQSPFAKEKLARSTALNFIGQFLPLIAGIGLMPYIVRGLGADRFGLLGIVWLVFGYFGLFDFGLGRATTKFVAEWLARDDPEAGAVNVPALVWTSILFQSVLGLVGCLVLCTFSSALADRVLKIPANLIQESRLTFYILAASLPVVLVHNSLRAVLEGCQRFDVVNLLRIPSSVLVFVIPAIAIPLGLRLPGIVASVLVSRLFFIAAHLIYCFRLIPRMRTGPVLNRDILRRLLAYGGWVTVGNIVNPILVSIDRFLIGSLLSVAMVGYYTASFEALSKLWLIPNSLTITIFPACSALGLTRKRELSLLYFRSLKYLFLFLAPISLVGVIFGKEIVELWLGAAFAAKSAIVFQILAIGIPVNCFAHIPYCYLQALDRPRSPAVLFLWELPAYAVLVWFAIRHYGIAGAATAWSARVAIEASILMFMVWRIFRLSPAELLGKKHVLRGMTMLGIMAIALVATKLVLGLSLPMTFSAVVLWLACFALSGWKYILDATDRGALMALMRPLRGATRSQAAA
jgi:O-antigen/teichoic acid export membrane protein